jgi:hypothetical protein
MEWGIALDVIEILLLIFLGFFIRHISSYSTQKGRNLATREDIGAITKEVEKVRSEYSEHLENLSHQNKLILEQGNRRHQLRLAALDRRIEAHQKAYSLWRELLHATHDKGKIGDVVLKCQNWWENNCLYLEADVREAFNKAYIAANSHREFVEIHSNPELVKSNWATIKNAGDVIVKAVELPPIADGEFKAGINLEKSDV